MQGSDGFRFIVCPESRWLSMGLAARRKSPRIPFLALNTPMFSRVQERPKAFCDGLLAHHSADA